MPSISRSPVMRSETVFFRDVVCPLLTAGTVLEPVGGEARLPVWVRHIDKRPRFYLRFGSEPEKKLVRSILEVST